MDRVAYLPSDNYIKNNARKVKVDKIIITFQISGFIIDLLFNFSFFYYFIYKMKIDGNFHIPIQYNA